MSQVDARDFAEAASGILNRAWPAPCFYYTPEYLRWQFAFPSSEPAALAVSAFDGAEPIGFAGITPRRIRRGLVEWDAGIVSFVAVLPEWRGKGVSAQLYAALLELTRDSGMPLITFAIAESGGERALSRAYDIAKFHIQPLGRYPVYGSMVRSLSDGPRDDWRTEYGDQSATALAEAAAFCAEDSSIIWNSPTPAQASHYFGDPRPRRLIVIRKEGSLRGAAWVVRSQFRSPRDVQEIVSLESVFLPRRFGDALPALLRAAALAWRNSAESIIVNAPSLHGFEQAALRKAGIRQTPTVFAGYLCGADIPSALCEGVEGTNLEIV